MTRPLQVYQTPELTVTFDPSKCVHSATCLRGLPAVFNVRRRPWVEAGAAPADQVAAQVARCPSGALQTLPAGAPVPGADAPGPAT